MLNATIAISITAIVALSAFYSGAYAIYEDELKVCNFEDVCQVIAIDDYMTRQSADKLQYNFANDLDTFDATPDNSQNKQDFHEDMAIELDNICREQYFKFCFGSTWHDLGIALLNIGDKSN